MDTQIEENYEWIHTIRTLKLSTADEKLEVLRAKKEKYKTLKKGLLQKLLSGEVRV